MPTARRVTASSAAIMATFAVVLALLSPNAYGVAAPQTAPRPPIAARAPASIVAAVAAAGAAGIRSGIAVLDTATGQYYEAGDASGEYPSESVVKVLIAARLLADGQMTGNTEQEALEMISQSDDDAANSLWGLVGGPDVVSWAEQHYGITDLGAPPTNSGRWGNTKLTPRGITEFYAATKADPVVGPWLVSAMHHMTPQASDGTNQTFGLPSTSLSGAYKQGWGGDDDNFDSEGLNSTGLLDNDRYAVAVFTQHIPYVPFEQLVPVINALAAAVAPGGTVAPLQPSTVVAPIATTSSTVIAPTATTSSTVIAPTATASSTVVAPTAQPVSSPLAAPSPDTPTSGAANSAAVVPSQSGVGQVPATPQLTTRSPEGGSADGIAGTAATGRKHTRGINAAEAGGLGASLLAIVGLLGFFETRRRRAVDSSHDPA